MLCMDYPSVSGNFKSQQKSTEKWTSSREVLFLLGHLTYRTTKDTKTLEIGPMTKVDIVEVGLRDGLQNDPAMMDTANKLEFIDRLIDAGIKRMEVASFVNPKRVPQMADSAEVMAQVPRDKGVQYIGLALNDRGLERALEAKCEEINFAVVASDTFGLKNQNATAEQSLEVCRQMIGDAKAKGANCSITIGAAFGCPFEGEVPLERVVWIAEESAKTGVTEIALADTIGVATPWDVTRRIEAVKNVIGDISLRAHFHNTRNTGIANAFAAIEAGVHVLDASCGGIGGCPFAPRATGNIATEDLLYMLERAGIETGVDLDKIIETSTWLEGALNHSIPAMVSKAGGFPKPQAA